MSWSSDGRAAALAYSPLLASIRSRRKVAPSSGGLNATAMASVSAKRRSPSNVSRRSSMPVSASNSNTKLRATGGTGDHRRSIAVATRTSRPIREDGRTESTTTQARSRSGASSVGLRRTGTSLSRSLGEDVLRRTPRVRSHSDHPRSVRTPAITRRPACLTSTRNRDGRSYHRERWTRVDRGNSPPP